MNEEHTDWYWEGVMQGLSAASVVIRQNPNASVKDLTGQIETLYRSIKNKRASPMVSGEAEWQSWLIEAELQQWDHDAASLRARAG